MTYIIAALIALLLIFLLIFPQKKSKAEKKLTPLAGLSFSLIIAGIIFSEQTIIGYSLIGAGGVLAVFDLIKRTKNGRPV